MPPKPRLKVPYLGKVALYWCKNCNVPLIDNFNCGICNSRPYQVKISPPGDVKPAFQADYHTLKETVNRQFGEGVGSALFSQKNIVLMNRIGGLDRNDEIILHGRIIGILSYNIIKQKFEFQPKLAGGQLIFSLQNQLGLAHKQIWLKTDALKFVLEGKSILAPGVIKCSEDIQEDDYCIAIGESQENNSLICCSIGIARGNFSEIQKMVTENHGMVAKNKEYLHFSILEEGIKEILLKIGNPPFSDANLNNMSPAREKVAAEIRTLLINAFEANRIEVEKKRDQAIDFIKNTIHDIAKPVAVAYSGGKDSLAVYLLVYRAIGSNFKVFFADTGLELPEVLENIQSTVSAFDMESKLVMKSAGDKFWGLVESFGPPGRDYRFCCHTLKAQQIMEIINELYNGDQVLVFLGQRQYESINRAQSKSVYVNSFIPLQIAATPIKTWNSLTLWLFLLFEQAEDPKTGELINYPINPLYFEGHDRLGCYLCPASNLSTLNFLKNTHSELYSRWFTVLGLYAEKYQLPRAWIDYGLWRFKKHPPMWRNFMKEHELAITFIEPQAETTFEISITKGFSPCLQSGYSIKGRFSLPVDLEASIPFLQILSKNLDWDEELNVIHIKGQFKQKDFVLNLFADGSFFLQSQDKGFEYVSFIKNVVSSIYRAKFCNQCGSCLSICPTKALSLQENRVVIDPLKCSHCLNCQTHCSLYQHVKEINEKLF
jgi:phosphoadenosine phosphosulfate reductase